MKLLASIALIPTVLMCSASNAQEIPRPKVVVYKTRGNYKKLVPVTLSDDGSRIVSYPGIEDLKEGQEPTKLCKGYWLDNGGRINKHVAFLKWTYEEYKNLKEIPSLKEMFTMLEDKQPLLELYDCNAKTPETTIKKLKKLIRKHRLKENCKEIL
jgi:hypothetical protein